MLEDLLLTKGGLLVVADKSVASDECFISEGTNVLNTEVCRIG